MADTTCPEPEIRSGDLFNEKPAGTTSSLDRETELKLSFDVDQLDPIISFFGIDAANLNKRHLSTTYFDTAGASLRDQGLSLHVRHDGRKYVQTIKGKDEGVGGVLQRREIEASIPSFQPEIEAIDDAVIADVVRRSTLTGLKPLFQVEVERISTRTSVNNADVTAEEAFLMMIHASLDQLIANEPCVTRTKNPAGVHQMRVALRRMRSAFRLFRPLLPIDHYDDFVGELRWLASALGPARDWDVFSTEIIGPALKQMPDHDGLAILKRRADVRRGRARNTAREAIASPRFSAFVLRVSAWAIDRAWRNRIAPGVSAQSLAPARDFATIAIAKRFKRVRKLGCHIEILSVPERHELRIEVKKLRYAIQFFRSLYDPGTVKPYSRALTVLQDNLGYLNDVAVAGKLAGEIASSARGRDRELLRTGEGLLVGWHNHGLAACENDLIKTVNALLNAPRFWETPAS